MGVTASFVKSFETALATEELALRVEASSAQTFRVGSDARALGRDELARLVRSSSAGPGFVAQVESALGQAAAS